MPIRVSDKMAQHVRMACRGLGVLRITAAEGATFHPTTRGPVTLTRPVTLAGRSASSSSEDERDDDVELTPEDEEIIRKNGLDREKFIEARRRQVARGATSAGGSQSRKASASGFLTAEDEEIIRKNGLDREKFILARARQLAQGMA